MFEESIPYPIYKRPQTSRTYLGKIQVCDLNSYKHNISDIWCNFHIKSEYFVWGTLYLDDSTKSQVSRI